MRNVQKLTTKNLDPRNEVEKGNIYAFDNKVISILGESIDLPPAAPKTKSLSEDDDEGIDNLGQVNSDGKEDPSIIPQDDCIYNQGIPYLEKYVADTLICSEVMLPQGKDLNIRQCTTPRNIG